MRIIVVSICLLLFSCTKEIKIDQVDYQTKIVVDGWIENNGYAHVILTRSSPFLTEYDSASIRNTFLNYAKVTLSNGKGQSEVLTLSRQKDFFPPFIYKSTDIKGEIGETYELEVIYQNKIVSSVTTIPLLPDVKDVFSDNVSDTSMYIMAHIEDNSLSENYYYSQIFVKHIDTHFHPSGNPLQNDRLFNGKEHTFQVKRSNQPDPLNIHNIDGNRQLVRDEFAIDDTVLVRQGGISGIKWYSY